MTSWQVAALPLWFVGFIFCLIAIRTLYGWKKRDGERLSELMGQCVVGLVFGVPFLAVAAWMWNV